mgnify:CR=1 FL=1
MTPQDFLTILSRAAILKTTTRHCYTQENRKESVADHSWRIALMAMLLSGEPEFQDTDMNKVIRMCLIHDLGELYAGDIPAISNTDPLAKSKQEYLDICRIFQLLPEPKRSEFLSLWNEYNNCSIPEAHLVKALDKAETILQHNQGKIHRILIMHSISLTEPPTSKAIRGWRN